MQGTGSPGSTVSCREQMASLVAVQLRSRREDEICGVLPRWWPTKARKPRQRHHRLPVQSHPADATVLRQEGLSLTCPDACRGTLGCGKRAYQVAVVRHPASAKELNVHQRIRVGS